MIATIDDAHLLFGRWKDEAPALRVKLMSRGLILEATGTVAEFTTATLQLNGPAWQFTIPLEGAEYTFSDPREIPLASVRSAETAKYEFGLAVKLPAGDSLVLMEIKTYEEVNDDES
ncbi:MAG: hypothetical protein ABI811_02300 [Acidobacteriota bacterium]